jgi:transcription initiation factor IIE alpha subunit
MSPDEMTSAIIEQRIADCQKVIDENPNSAYRRDWERAVDRLTEILKERAEDGTYDTAGRY